MWETLLKKAGLYTRDEKSGRNQYRIHSLRKFFISQLSMAGARTLAEHLAGHTGYLDASYRQVSPEFAAREYLKLQSVLIVCIPENIKAGIKMADEKISILSEKTELQSESIEGLKIMNSQLRLQIAQNQEETRRIANKINEEAREFIRKRDIEWQNNMAELKAELLNEMETRLPAAKYEGQTYPGQVEEGAAIAKTLLSAKKAPAKKSKKQ